MEQFRRTGKHLGVFDSPETATSYAKQLHESQDALYGNGLKNCVVEATFDNDHFRRFRIVGACEGDVPVMTYAVAREGFYDKGRSYAVDMRIIKGDPDQLMKEQEAAKVLRDYLENGNIRNSVNFPNVYLDRSGVMRMCIIHKNIPAMLASITTLLSKDGVNVENLSNKSKGDYAYTMVDLGSKVAESVIEDVKHLPNVIRVRVIE